ncbi:MAG: PAS domain S-box protein [Deltaproteobacteria bacterium]|nr:PAS domain S-box protein [Deltaproteobacteria bacterium]
MSGYKLSPSGQNVKEIIPDAIIIHTNGVIRFVNPAGLRLFGFSSVEEIIGKDVFPFVRPADHDLVQERIRQIETEEIFQSPIKEMKLLHRDGSVLNTVVTAVCANYKGMPAVMTIVKDMRGWKQEEEGKNQRAIDEAECRLKEAEEKALTAMQKSRGLEVVLDSIDEGVAMYNADARVLWTNRRHVELTGEDITGSTWDEWKKKFQQMFFHYPDGLRLSREEYPAVRVLRGITLNNELLAFSSLTGTETVVSVSGTPIVEEGEIRGALIAMRDVTKEEQARNSLQKSIQTHSDILESIDDGFLTINQNWQISFANRRVVKALGLTEDIITHKNIWEAVPKLFDSDIGKNLRQVMEEKKSRRLEYRSRLTNRSYRLSVYPFVSGISVYVIDVTKMKAD